MAAGAGGNTLTHHIPKLRAIEGVSVVAISNRTTESAQRVASEISADCRVRGGSLLVCNSFIECSLLQATDDWTTVTGDPGIDAIVIGTW